MAPGQLLVIPSCSRIRRQHSLIGSIDTRIALGTVRAQVEVEYLREQTHDVEVDLAIRLELVDQHRGAGRSVALTEEVLRRVTARVLRQELREEFRESVSVGIDTVERLLLVLARDAAESGAGRINKDQVRGIEQTRSVVDQGIGRGRRVDIRRSDDPAWAECAHVQPERCGPGSAVEYEGDRAGPFA